VTALTTGADGVDVVHHHASAAPGEHAPLLVLGPLEDYLDSIGMAPGQLSWARIGDGQANITYELRRGGERLVLRRGPRPPFPPSAHDMLREARVLKAVGGSGVPVPEVVAVCEDLGVLGAPFYLMPFVEGHVITTSLPVTLLGRGAAVVESAVSALAALHAVPLEGDVAALGRPVGYLDRQVARFSRLWPQNTRREVREVTETAAALAANVPTSARASVVHGDYRLGNLLIDDAGRVSAVLDWEMATLGDPLADLGYLTATYTTADGPRTPMDLSPVTAGPGFPGRAEIIARYASVTGADVSELRWYEALALWKSAIFCEAMYTRWLDGERPGDTFAPRMKDGVPALARAAASALADFEKGRP